MAYVSQEKKAALLPGIKAVLNKYKLKGTVSVNNHSTPVVTITSGPLNFIDNMWEVSQSKPQLEHMRAREKPTYMCVNEFWIHDHYTGVPRACLLELKAAMQGADWFDHSDMQSDYFNCSHYLNMNVGKYGKPYILVKG